MPPPIVSGLKFACAGASSETQNDALPTASCETTSGAVVGAADPIDLHRPERLLVELDGLAPATNRELRHDAHTAAILRLGTGHDAVSGGCSPYASSTTPSGNVRVD